MPGFGVFIVLRVSVGVRAVLQRPLGFYSVGHVPGTLLGSLGSSSEEPCPVMGWWLLVGAELNHFVFVFWKLQRKGLIKQ